MGCIMKITAFIISIFVACLTLVGCNLPIGNTPKTIYPTEVIQTLEPIVWATETRSVVVIVETPSPMPEQDFATVTPSVTATPYVPFTINTFVNAVNVRTNPGYLFPIRGMVQSNTPLTLLGRSPGNEWFYIQTPDKIYGWVFNKLFSADERLLQAPLVEPEDVQIVQGLLLDATGNPVSGVQFALTQGSGGNVARTDASSGEDGLFLAFMPINSSGTWNVSYVAISCDSNMADANCNFNGSVFPPSMQINLPSDEVLAFTWK